MLNICQGGKGVKPHKGIVFYGEKCPLCKKMEELAGEISELKEELEELKNVLNEM